MYILVDGNSCPEDVGIVTCLRQGLLDFYTWRFHWPMIDKRKYYYYIKLIPSLPGNRRSAVLDCKLTFRAWNLLPRCLKHFKFLIQSRLIMSRPFNRTISLDDI